MPDQKPKTQEQLWHKEMLRARAKALARREIELAKTPRFQKGKLIESKRYNVLKNRLENMRLSVRKDYNQYQILYVAT